MSGFSICFLLNLCTRRMASIVYRGHRSLFGIDCACVNCPSVRLLISGSAPKFIRSVLTLNPKKCEFGLSEVEFVGHTINDTGISFSKEKLHEVVTFRHMTTQKELRSFLGLGNYFIDHVLNYSIQSLSPTTSYFLDTTAVSRIESCQRCYQRVSSIIFCG